MIDLNEYSNKIKGEVVDINGKHLFGDIDIIDSKVDILKYLKFNSVKDGYVYRGVPLIKDDSIKYIYILKAPFSYTVNNINYLTFNTYGRGEKSQKSLYIRRN